MKTLEELEKIPINIWDDFYGDEDIPKGKIQETFIFFEENISLVDKDDVMMYIYPFVLEFFKHSVTKVKYDGNKIWLLNITHEILENDLIPYLQSLNLIYKSPLNFYSES